MATMKLFIAGTLHCALVVVGGEISLRASIAARETSLGQASGLNVSQDSAAYCASKGMGGGEVIGTSPACEGACQDCGDTRACEMISESTGLTDYGYGCFSGFKVLCCNPSPKSAIPDEESDHLTVMTFNTFLMEINVVLPMGSKPDIGKRASRIAEWFSSLRVSEVPDVLVLNEIFSSDAEVVLQQLCTEDWYRNSAYYASAYTSHGWLKKCNPNSHFEFATSVVSPGNSANPLKGGGVVVLVRKGITVIRAIDQVYRESGGSDALARKGFFAVNLVKGTQPYWVLGTHTQANEGKEMVNIRLAQFAQMKQFVESNTGPDDRVVFAGDMNTFTGDDSGGIPCDDETDGMLAALNAVEGWMEPKGFWLPLDDSLYTSVCNIRNHYANHLDFEYGAQLFDRILAYRGGVLPREMKHQVVPVKSSDCFESELKPGNSDDLSDHFALFASLCYSEKGCTVEPVRGHRGSGIVFPSSTPNC